MALGPGAVSQRHADPKYSLRLGLVRLHLPITTNPDAVLVLDGVAHRWQAGELWFGEFSRPHYVQNHGDRPRVHLVIDALLTEALAHLFPTPWHHWLLTGDVLLNRPVAPEVQDGGEEQAWRLDVPESFTDFDTNDPLAEGSPRLAVQLARTRGQAHLVAADQRVFALLPVAGHRQELRFAGWSEQRTIQLGPTGAVLRARHGRAAHKITVPVIPIAAGSS